MRKIRFVFIFFITYIVIWTMPESFAGYTKGYYKSNGKYVQGYYKANNNSYKFDNYSAKWNYNPYTWKKGYKSWY